MRWWPRVSSCGHVGKILNIRWLYFPHWMSRWEKKHATCTIFSASCTKPNDPLCCKRPRQSLYINLFHSLSPKWSSHFSAIPSLRGWYFRKKTSTCHMYSTLLRIAQRVSTCIIHVQLAESRPEGQCLVRNKWSQPFGWIHILNRVSQSSFGILAGTCPCIMFVNAGDLE